MIDVWLEMSGGNAGETRQAAVDKLREGHSDGKRPEAAILAVDLADMPLRRVDMLGEDVAAAEGDNQDNEQVAADTFVEHIAAVDSRDRPHLVDRSRIHAAVVAAAIRVVDAQRMVPEVEMVVVDIREAADSA